LACRHATLDSDVHAAVLHCAAVDRTLDVVSKMAKFRPATVILSVVVNPRLGLKASLNTGAACIDVGALMLSTVTRTRALRRAAQSKLNFAYRVPTSPPTVTSVETTEGEIASQQLIVVADVHTAVAQTAESTFTLTEES